MPPHLAGADPRYGDSRREDDWYGGPGGGPSRGLPALDDYGGYGDYDDGYHGAAGPDGLQGSRDWARSRSLSPPGRQRASRGYSPEPGRPQGAAGYLPPAYNTPAAGRAGPGPGGHQSHHSGYSPPGQYGPGGLSDQQQWREPAPAAAVPPPHHGGGYPHSPVGQAPGRGRGQPDWHDSMFSPPQDSHPYQHGGRDGYAAAAAPRDGPGREPSYHSRGVQDYCHGRSYSPGAGGRSYSPGPGARRSYSPVPGCGRSRSPGSRPGSARDWPPSREQEQEQEHLSEAQQQRWLDDTLRQWQGDRDVALAMERLCDRRPAVLAMLAGYRGSLVSELQSLSPPLALLCLLHVHLSALAAVRSLPRFLSGLMRSMGQHFVLAPGASYTLQEYYSDLQLLAQMVQPSGGYSRPARHGDVPHMVAVWDSHPALKRLVEGLYSSRVMPERSSMGPLHLALLDSMARKGRLDEAQAVMHRFSQHLSDGTMVNDGGMLMKLLSGAGRG